MKKIKIMILNKKKIKRNLLIAFGITISLYIVTSLFFHNHFLFHTEINGANVSLKQKSNFNKIMEEFIGNYTIEVIERDGSTQILTGKELGLSYTYKDDVSGSLPKQNPFLWFRSLFKDNKYIVSELFTINLAALQSQTLNLNCSQKLVIEPRNVDFIFENGSYQLVKEIKGNRILPDQLLSTLIKYLSDGKSQLDLEIANCYMKPTYRTTSHKAKSTQNLLNRYVKTKITYSFGDLIEILDGTTVNSWLAIDDNLDVNIIYEDLIDYVYTLSKKYDTVGKPREFQTSYGKIIEIKDGLYGWKINREAEANAIYNHILLGETVEKEPAYLQTAYSREGNEIGNTYLEINITRQHLWFYKEGKLITQGAIVTGNPNRGNGTVLGVYMLNYKQKGATLRGPDYASDVTYWMPFFGNIGLHDASWRTRFGGEIYKRNGSHGCVNAPLYLAKAVYQHIEPNTPIILYIEKNP